MRMAFIIRKGQHWHCLHVFSVRRRLEAGNFNKRMQSLGIWDQHVSRVFSIDCFSNLLGRESCKGAFEARGASLLHKTGSVKNPNIFLIQMFMVSCFATREGSGSAMVRSLKTPASGRVSTELALSFSIFYLLNLSWKFPFSFLYTYDITYWE